MKKKLTTLYNELSEIETKGESTKRMARSLRFLEQTINEIIREEQAERVLARKDDKNKPEENTTETDSVK